MLQRVLKDGRVQGVDDVLTVPARLNQAGVAEHLEMMRNRGECHLEMPGDLPRGKVLVAKQLQNATPGRIGQGTKRLINHR